MIEVVPKAFVEIDIEKDFYKDCLKIRCRRTGLCLDISHFELENLGEIPPKRLDLFPDWIKEHFLHRQLYVVNK